MKNIWLLLLLIVLQTAEGLASSRKPDRDTDKPAGTSRDAGRCPGCRVDFSYAEALAGHMPYCKKLLALQAPQASAAADAGAGGGGSGQTAPTSAKCPYCSKPFKKGKKLPDHLARMANYACLQADNADRKDKKRAERKALKAAAREKIARNKQKRRIVESDEENSEDEDKAAPLSDLPSESDSDSNHQLPKRRNRRIGRGVPESSDDEPEASTAVAAAGPALAIEPAADGSNQKREEEVAPGRVSPAPSPLPPVEAPALPVAAAPAQLMHDEEPHAEAEANDAAAEADAGLGAVANKNQASLDAALALLEDRADANNDDESDFVDVNGYEGSPTALHKKQDPEARVASAEKALGAPAASPAAELHGEGEEEAAETQDIRKYARARKAKTQCINCHTRYTVEAEQEVPLCQTCEKAQKQALSTPASAAGRSRRNAPTAGGASAAGGGGGGGSSAGVMADDSSSHEDEDDEDGDYGNDYGARGEDDEEEEEPETAATNFEEEEDGATTAPATKKAPAKPGKIRAALAEATTDREKRYICGYCDYRSKNSNDVAKHENTHTGAKPYKCKFCDYAAASRGSVRTHEKKHTGTNQFNCTECIFIGKTIGALRQHTVKDHAEKADSVALALKCSMCHYVGQEPRDLIRHMLVHTGEKPYKCSQCDYRAKEQGKVSIHERTHTKEKPFKCSFCEFRAKVRSSVKTHEMTHTGDKPHECTLCWHKTTTGQNLTRHMQMHEGARYIKCSMVDKTGGLCSYNCDTGKAIKTHEKDDHINLEEVQRATV